MDTREIKGSVLDFDVLALTSAQIKDMDEQEFCKVAVRLDRVVDAASEVGVSVAEYVHAFVIKLIERNGGYPYDKDVMLREFLGSVASWESYLKSPAAGAYQVEELPKSIDQAKRKIQAGIERNADFRIENTCSKVASATSKHNKAEKKRKEDDAILAYQKAHGLDENKGGPQMLGGDAANASAVELEMAKLSKLMEEINELDPERVKFKLRTLKDWADETLAELKSGLGDRVVNG